MPEYRIKSIPPGLWRRVKAKAGDDLQAVLRGLLVAYADNKIDPLSQVDPGQAARGAKGGSARVRNQTAEERSASARRAVNVRYGKRLCPARTDGGACQPFATDGSTCEFCGQPLAKG